MVRVAKYGLMVRFMMVIGRMIWLMDVEDSFMQMVIYTKESGQMTRQVVRVLSSTSMVQNTKASGRTISNMGRG